MLSECIYNYFYLLVLCICFFNDVCCAKTDVNNTNGLESKIIGGRETSMEEFPWLTQLINLGSLCAGTILNSLTIMTAAHCFDYNSNVEDMIVQVGARFSYDIHADIYDVIHFIKHEEYNRSQIFSSDIALVFLSETIKFGERAKKAILVDNDKWMNVKEINFIACGWGWTQENGSLSDKGLLMTSLSYVPKHECEKLHNVTLSSDMFCLYGDGVTDTCKGDSGGSILWQNMVVGIVSYGDGCAQKDKPSVYSNVFFFKDWLQDQMKRYAPKHCHYLRKFQHFIIRNGI